GRIFRQVADYLLRINKISGPIHAGLTGEKEFPAIAGIDDPTHYRANVEAYRRSSPLMEEYRKRITGIRGELERRKAEVFNLALLAFDREVRSHEEGKANFGEHVRNLCIHSLPTPVVKDFLRTVDMEASLDFREVERQ